MKKSCLLLLSFIFASCVTKLNISNENGLKKMIGHSVNTRIPLKLYELNYQISGYKNRYELGGNVLGQPLVGVVPAGHSVFFEKAICRNGPAASTEHLEGNLEFRGKNYPIAYFLGLRNQDSSRIWKGLNYDFVIPK